MTKHLAFCIEKDKKAIKKETKNYKSDLSWSTRLLLWSCVAMAMGAAAVVFTFIDIIW